MNEFINKNKCKEEKKIILKKPMHIYLFIMKTILYLSISYILICICFYKTTNYYFL